MRRFKLTAVAMAFAVLLCGCSLTGLDAQTLISPPKANTDQQAIYALLKSDEGEINFIYPKNGDYRSAVIMQDFTGNGSEDAIGFSADPEGGIRLRFMVKDDDTWRTVAAAKNSSTQVDRVMFGDLNGDSVNEIIVGWGAPQSMTATLCVYSYAQGKIKEFQLDHGYNESIVTDLDGDGVQELFTATVFTQTEEEAGKDKSAVARVFSLEDRPVMKYSLVLNDTVVKYASASFSLINRTQKGVVLEGQLAEGSIISQVIYLGENGLVSPLSGKSMQKRYNYFLRPTTLPCYSKDINNDGIIEFPKISLQPGTPKDTPQDSTAYYVDWVRLDSTFMSPITVERGIYNYIDNYMMTIPEGREITCVQSEIPRELSFEESIYTSTGTMIYTRRLFSIRAFTTEEWADEKTREGYGLLISTQSNLVYGIQNFSDNVEELKKGIKLISE